MLLSLFLLALTSCTEEMQRIKFNNTSSPAGHEVIVSYDAPFGFGPHKLFISTKMNEDAGEKDLFDTPLYNDGANLRPKNVGLEWIDDHHLELSLKGKEQDDALYQITFSEEAKWELVSGKSE